LEASTSVLSSGTWDATKTDQGCPADMTKLTPANEEEKPRGGITLADARKLCCEVKCNVKTANALGAAQSTEYPATCPGERTVNAGRRFPPGQFLTTDAAYGYCCPLTKCADKDCTAEIASILNVAAISKVEVKFLSGQVSVDFEAAPADAKVTGPNLGAAKLSLLYKSKANYDCTADSDLSKQLEIPTDDKEDFEGTDGKTYTYKIKDGRGVDTSDSEREYSGSKIDVVVRNFVEEAAKQGLTLPASLTVNIKRKSCEVDAGRRLSWGRRLDAGTGQFELTLGQVATGSSATSRFAVYFTGVITFLFGVFV